MRGARVEKIWHVGALGMLDRLDELLVPEIDPEHVCQGFRPACAAGQRRAAGRLLQAGADFNWESDYARNTALDAANGLGTRQNSVIAWLQSSGARSMQRPSDSADDHRVVPGAAAHHRIEDASFSHQV
jgi:hypothetical protein